MDPAPVPAPAPTKEPKPAAAVAAPVCKASCAATCGAYLEVSIPAKPVGTEPACNLSKCFKKDVSEPSNIGDGCVIVVVVAIKLLPPNCALNHTFSSRLY